RSRFIQCKLYCMFVQFLKEVAKYEKRSVCEFIVTRTDHIVEHIIPFFEEHPVVGSKHFNYLDFKSATYILKNKEHLNPDGKGLEQILQLKSGMNKDINNHSETGKEEFRSEKVE